MANDAKTPSPAYIEFAAAFRARHPDVDEGTLFGMRSLKFAGKAFAGGFDGGLAIKASPEDFARLVEGGHAVPFDPSRKGRPMGGGWLVIGTDQTDEWMPLAEAARLLLVETLG